VSDVIAINDLQAFYFKMKERLQIKNKELEEAYDMLIRMQSHADEFSRFFSEGYITEIKHAQVKKDIKGVLDYYQKRVNRLNDLIPDIEDYIYEYEQEYGAYKK
jgi:predicted nuclease with TOPRIM domain